MTRFTYNRWKFSLSATLRRLVATEVLKTYLVEAAARLDVGTGISVQKPQVNDPTTTASVLVSYSPHPPTAQLQAPRI